MTEYIGPMTTWRYAAEVLELSPKVNMTSYPIGRRHVGVGISNPIKIRSWTTNILTSSDTAIFRYFQWKQKQLRIFKACSYGCVITASEVEAHLIFDVVTCHERTEWCWYVCLQLENPFMNLLELMIQSPLFHLWRLPLNIRLDTFLVSKKTVHTLFDEQSKKHTGTKAQIYLAIASLANGLTNVHCHRHNCWPWDTKRSLRSHFILRFALHRYRSWYSIIPSRWQHFSDNVSAEIPEFRICSHTVCLQHAT